jgi:hypothetical protein
MKAKADIVQSRINGLAASARSEFQMFEFKFRKTYKYELKGLWLCCTVGAGRGKPA